MMRYRLLATLATAFTLAGCESTTCDQKSDTLDWAAPVQKTEEAPVMTSSVSEDFKKSCQDRVFFDYDKSNVKPEFASVLDGVAKWLAENPSVSVTVEGHCDARGTEEYNLPLGQKRANSVEKALVSRGVNASRVKTVSYGKERPTVEGNSEEAYAQNRRGVVVID